MEKIKNYLDLSQEDLIMISEKIAKVSVRKNLINYLVEFIDTHDKTLKDRAESALALDLLIELKRK